MLALSFEQMLGLNLIESTGPVLTGPITREDVVIAFNDRLMTPQGMDPKNLVDINDSINGCLSDLSGRALWPDLKTTDTITLKAGDESIAVPAGLIAVDAVIINDGTRDHAPLATMDFLSIRRNRSFSPYGLPRYCWKSGQTIELWPTCDQAYTASLSYYRHHPRQNAILFTEPFREALNVGTMAKWLQAHGLGSEPLYEQLARDYEMEIAKLMGEGDALLTVQQYNDL